MSQPWFERLTSAFHQVQKDLTKMSQKQQMRLEVRALAKTAAGFLTEAEGVALFDLACSASRRAPALEIGSYAGKSSLYLAEGCRNAGSHPLICVDHHRGSVEQQKGEMYFDPAVYDAEMDSVYTLDMFMRNIARASLTEWVVPVVADSATASRYLSGHEVSLLFIDGGHSDEDVQTDLKCWGPSVLAGGYLCVHDLFQDPTEGGQAPLHVFEEARQSGDWDYVRQVDTLGILRRR